MQDLVSLIQEYNGGPAQEGIQVENVEKDEDGTIDEGVEDADEQAAAGGKGGVDASAR